MPLRSTDTAFGNSFMPKSTIVDSMLAPDQCSRSEFQAQRERVEGLLRDAGRAAMKESAVADDELRRAVE